MMPLSGYADRWSVARGDTIRFMVSCETASFYTADIVRLRQPEVGPSGQAFDPELVPGTRRSYPGRRQPTRVGSLGYVALPSFDLSPGGFTIMAYVRPTSPDKGRQAIMGCWSDTTETGFGLEIGPKGSLRLVVGGLDGPPAELDTGSPLAAIWYRVAATFDPETGTARLWQEPVSRHCIHMERWLAVEGRMKVAPLALQTPMTFAAWCLQPGTADDPACCFVHHFNGCIDRPRLATGCLSRSEIALLDATPLCDDLAGRVVGAWDFSHGMSGDAIHDLGPRGLVGQLVNQPTRGVPGHDWDGETDWTSSPDRYGAIHFHDDDLVDARWETDFVFAVPDAMHSGVYSARLRADVHEYWIPFVVRPVRGEPGSPVALLLPTATYDAYRNHRGRFDTLANERLHGRLNTIDATDAMFIETPEMGLSTYDRHSDGSGVTYAGRLRPAQNIRPTGRLWNFSVDLLIVSWLDRLGGVYDVLTDEDLHHEGVDLLSPYRVLITGSHPEYASRRMLDALEGFLHGGGRLMSMGGNGFYWRIAFHPHRRGIMEVRRVEGVRAWDAEPGASHMSFDGTRGGLWRANGRAPQCLTGVGFISQGFDRCSYYRKTAAASDPRIAWAFEGVASACLGADGVLLGGAAGIEIDATNRRLGTPSHALVIARSENHSNIYEMAVEEVMVPHGATDALINPDIAAEMTFFETPSGGAVFSTGSVAYAGSLGWNDFDNDIFRLTSNVLARFEDVAPFDRPATSTAHDIG